MPDDFDALRDCRGKTYQYDILCAAANDPLQPFTWHRRSLPEGALDRLQACAAALIGEHDLSGLACLRKDGSDPEVDGEGARTSVQSAWQHEMLPATPSRAQQQRLSFTIQANGFLYKQVRGIVGACWQVVSGQGDVTDFCQAIEAGISGTDHGTRRLHQVAPPEGLRLVAVSYDNPLPWESLDDREEAG